MALPQGLVGYSNFVRSNPRSDKFGIKCFHHVEWYCGDATNTSRRFSWGLGMTISAKSDLSTGNTACASYVAFSGDVRFVFTAPYAAAPASPAQPEDQQPLPGFDARFAHDFFSRHGFAARAVGLEVEDAAEAYATATSSGATGVLAPVTLRDEAGEVVVSEVAAYGDVVLRFVSGPALSSRPFLPGYEAAEAGPALDYGIRRIDHCVGNVPELLPAVRYLMGATGMHEFAEFTAEDVGTVDSGLNSMVLASNNEAVLLPINEPTHGTRRKSQIQTYLEMNGGAGLQHIALKTNDIFSTMRELKKRTYLGGFDFMAAPDAAYYARVPERIGEDVLTAGQLAELQELGLLADRDDQGVLLQVFSKPLGDRATVFIEIIQRVGCDTDPDTGARVEQKPGCGGFGKGNFAELFKSIEDYERTLKIA